MKKIGLIAGLATMVTVGGVFAAWTVNGLTDLTNQQNSISINVEDTIHDLGKFNSSITGSLSIAFDQDDVKKGYEAVVSGTDIALSYTNETGKSIKATISCVASFEGTGATNFGKYVDTSGIIDSLKIENHEEIFADTSGTYTLLTASNLQTLINSEDKAGLVSKSNIEEFIEACPNTTLQLTVNVTYATV